MTPEEVAERMDVPIKFVRETLIKAFPVPDLRRKAAISQANPCSSTGGTKEVLN